MMRVSEEATMELMDRQHSKCEAYRKQLSREELVWRIGQSIHEDGTVEPLEGLELWRASAPTELGRGLSYPAFCVIAQGAKEVLLGENRYRYDPAHYLIATAALPIATHITEASRERPYLSLLLRLDPAVIGSVMVDAGHPAPHSRAPVAAIDVSPLDAALLDAVLRLVRLVESPEEARVLGPLVRREDAHPRLQGEQNEKLPHNS